MILSLFKRTPVRQTAIDLYERAVAQARDPDFYQAYGVPDSVEGRFEMVGLHVFLIMRRLRAIGSEAKDLNQALLDIMFQNMDDSLRELGVGDMSIGKKIRKMAENFYGRIDVYEKGLRENAPPAELVAALSRNIYGEEKSVLAARLANYVKTSANAMDAIAYKTFSEGVATFPEPDSIRIQTADAQ
ncbi:MAG: ubiquinol-cytochrome C chaperone family protein [Pseudomonadota bacterium]